jgi:prepilin-type N-terminal cleavage/methylation domain-containing protein
MKKNNTKKQEGFTLIELLVSMLVFSTVLIIITSSVGLILGGFRKIILGQNAQDEMRYVTEFMSREIRTAQCGAGVSDCRMFLLNSSIYTGTDQDLFPALEFINYKNEKVRYIFTQNAEGYGEVSRRCVLNDGSAPGSEKECEDNTIIDPPARPMTSKKIDIKGMTFIINGDYNAMVSMAADQRQPLLTIYIEALYSEGPYSKNIHFQTSISPRHLQS